MTIKRSTFFLSVFAALLVGILTNVHVETKTIVQPIRTIARTDTDAAAKLYSEIYAATIVNHETNAAKQAASEAVLTVYGTK